MRGRWAWPLLALFLALPGLTPSALAQVPERQRQFVYGFYTFKGGEYATGFVPASVETIYMLADHENVLDPKQTLVYFWPITNEFRADFAALNELVSGTLAVTRGGQPVVSLALTDYVVQVDQARLFDGQRLATGEAARTQHAAFERERAAYIERVNAHARAREEYLRRSQAGDRQATAPADPAPFTLFSTGLNRGFAIHLPAGEYAIDLRDPTGATVAGSQKRLVAIAPRRQGIGYEVVPQEKWTLPERSSDPSNAIYTAPEGVLYLRPFTAWEFNALEYARLQNPQDAQATPNRWTWVHLAPVETATLLVEGTGPPERLSLAPFAVEQVAGPALGYTIRPFVPGPEQAGVPPREPDLRAYRVASPNGRAAIRLALADAAGRLLAGGDRVVVVTPAVPDWLLALPLIVPLLVGLAVTLWRRRQIITARALSPEQRHRMA